MRRTCGWITAILIGLGATFGVALVRTLHAPILADDSPAPVPVVQGADWGADHVGEPVPNYASSTECLFCHRDYVGPRWPGNPHNRTMRTADASEPAMKTLSAANIGLKPQEVEILLGAGDHARYVRKLPEYGKLSVHSALWRRDAKNPESGTLLNTEQPHWDDKLFAGQCAGCHATGVDKELASVSSVGLECYVCHGLTEIEHTAKEVDALVSGKGGDARVETAVCSQCHLRGGVSKATGRPYPTNFVAGDNLLRDFQVNFSDKRMQAAEPYERHILVSARDVLVHNKADLNCTSCHHVHENNSKKHQELAETEYCAICHKPGRPLAEVDIPRPTTNKTCRY